MATCLLLLGFITLMGISKLNIIIFFVTTIGIEKITVLLSLAVSEVSE